MGKSRSSRHKVFSEEKKARKDKTLEKRITELELENSKLRREIDSLLAEGKVPVVKAKRPPRPKIKPPTVEELEQKRKEALEKVKKWREENLGKYEEE